MHRIYPGKNASGEAGSTMHTPVSKLPTEDIYFAGLPGQMTALYQVIMAVMISGLKSWMLKEIRYGRNV